MGKKLEYVRGKNGCDKNYDGRNLTKTKLKKQNYTALVTNKSFTKMF